ncbi:hypothetical protein [Grimontia marina]|uniref:hypothetical protein n=1 Tax=Grimontia marina TaxID=646534 RepID=UPI0012FAF201|nr:hypothetical protein [Grimontia marina]
MTAFFRWSMQASHQLIFDDDFAADNGSGIDERFFRMQNQSTFRCELLSLRFTFLRNLLYQCI